MMRIGELLSGPAALTVGWCLVHFLWQGTLVACVLACAVRLMRSRPANARCALAYAALLLMAASPVVTTLVLAGSTQAPSVPPAASAPARLYAI